MSNKQAFIEMVEQMLSIPETQSIAINPGAMDFFNELKTENSTKVSEKALPILQVLYSSNSNMMIASQIADELGISSRSVSGSMRKLCADGFVSKIGQNPVTYSITEDGRNLIDNIEKI